jgi:hypothetical protein
MISDFLAVVGVAIILIPPKNKTLIGLESRCSRKTRSFDKKKEFLELLESWTPYTTSSIGASFLVGQSFIKPEKLECQFEKAKLSNDQLPINGAKGNKPPK